MPVLDAFPAQLECNTIVFRVLKPSWFQEGFINSVAFELAQYKDGSYETGLSVLNNLENAKKPIARPKAIVTFHVGRIRDKEMNVIPDGEVDPFFDSDKIVHAEIQGMPPPDSAENRLIAERFANSLLELIDGRQFAWERS